MATPARPPDAYVFINPCAGPPAPQEMETSEKRADALLREYLSSYQEWLWVKYGFFYVRDRDGRFYALHDGLYVYVIDLYGRPVTQHGAYPYSRMVYESNGYTRGYGLPLADRVLGQMLWLETAPDDFFHLACSFPTGKTAVPALNDGRFFKAWRNECA